MRKADEDEFPDTGGQRSSHYIPHILDVCFRQELFRSRREEKPGEMNDAINPAAQPGKCPLVTEVGLDDGDIRQGRQIEWQWLAVDEKPQLVRAIQQRPS